MRTAFISVVVTLAALLIGTSAHATKINEARELCARNPKCTEHVTPDGAVFEIENDLGGHWQIACYNNPRLDCECVNCPRQTRWGRGIGRIEGIMLPSAAGALPGTIGRAP